jgi:hypothetical protein
VLVFAAFWYADQKMRFTGVVDAVVGLLAVAIAIFVVNAPLSPVEHRWLDKT